MTSAKGPDEVGPASPYSFCPQQVASPAASRVFDALVLQCRNCGGRSKVIAVIKDGLTSRKILEHLGLGDAQATNTQLTGPPQLDLPLGA